MRFASRGVTLLAAFTLTLSALLSAQTGTSSLR